MPRFHHKGWVKLVKLLLAAFAGGLVFYTVDYFLSPRPTITHLDGIRLVQHSYVREYDLDATGRYFCVQADGTAETPVERFLSYDLTRGGKPLYEFHRNFAGRIASTSIDQGLRMVKSTEGRLQIFDTDLTTGKQTRLPFDMPCPDQYERMQFAANGTQLVIFQRWYLWPWRTLAAMGQPAWDTLFLRTAGSSNCYDTIADGLIVSIYEVANSKLLQRVVLAPPVSSYYHTSANGRWLIVPEASVHPRHFCWPEPVDAPPSSPSVEILVPASPRGIRAVDLQTGQTQVLWTEELAQKNRKEAVAYYASIAGNLVRLHFTVISASKSRKDGYSMEPSNKAYAYPVFDLTTGKPSPLRFPDGYYLEPSGWNFSYSIPVRRWFPFLQRAASYLGVNLDESYPLPSRLLFQFSKTASLEETPDYEFPVNYDKTDWIRITTSHDGHVALAFRCDSAGTDIYRWQAPFAAYSLWWSIAAGILTTLLFILTCRHFSPLSRRAC
ncbi:MAG: hypothetical protein QM703_18830 [Gemmatales bacterium]